MNSALSTLALLKSFCSTDEDRKLLHEPWTRGDWTAASDGAICVRVPTIESVPDQKEAPDTTALFVASRNNHRNATYHKIPELPAPKQKLCEVCAGLRGVRRDPYYFPIEGEEDYYNDLIAATLPPDVGDIILEKDGVFKCPNCEGAGTIDTPQLLDIGLRRYSVRYLRLIAELPLVSAAFYSPFVVEENEPLHFLFAGSGEGLLMPMKKTTDTDALVVRVINDHA